MIVISDTSPISNLFLIGHLFLIRSKSAGLVPEVRPLLESLRTKAQFRIHEHLFYQVLQHVGEL